MKDEEISLNKHKNICKFFKFQLSTLYMFIAHVNTNKFDNDTFHESIKIVVRLFVISPKISEFVFVFIAIF